MNGFARELVEELATQGDDRRNEALGSLIRLAEANRGGQELVANEIEMRYSEFARLLYATTTSVRALTCLAICTRGSRQHQRRMMREIPGFVVEVADKSIGYVICVPEQANVEFKKWKHRQKALRGHRIPHGVPPAVYGAPEPCYCNDCLGSLQSFSIWSLHFNDLDRWIDHECFNVSSKPTFQEFIKAYMIHRNLNFVTKQVLLDDGSHDTSLLALTFSMEQDIVYDERLDPKRDIVAIAIDFELGISSLANVNSTKKSQTKTLSSVHHANPIQIGTILKDAPVLLYASQRYLSLCHYESTPEWDDEIEAKNTLVDHLRSLHDLFLSLDPNGDGSISKSEFSAAVKQHPEIRRQLLESLNEEIDDEDYALEQLYYTIGDDEAEFQWKDFIHYFGAEDRMTKLLSKSLPDESEIKAIMTYMVNCIADDDIDSTCAVSEQHECLVQVYANEQELTIHAKPPNSNNFSVQIPKSQLCLSDTTAFSLLLLSEESIETLVQKCCLCHHPSHKCIACQHHRLALRMASLPSPPASKTIQKTPPQPIPGLDANTMKEMRQCLDQVGTLSQESLLNKLMKWIEACNERVSSLSHANAFPKSTHPLRMAARERCQNIRRDLIDATRQLKLTPSAQLMAKTLENVLKESAMVNYWETFDERIHQLGLSNTVWANGYPDPTYLHEQTSRRCTRRKRSQKLKDAIRLARETIS